MRRVGEMEWTYIEPKIKQSDDPGNGVINQLSFREVIASAFGSGRAFRESELPGSRDGSRLAKTP